MLHIAPPLCAEQLFSIARTSEICVTLRAMCCYVTSQDGYLAADGFALHGNLREYPLIQPGSRPGEIRIIERQSDIALAYAGLSLSRVDAGGAWTWPTPKQWVAVVAVRLGGLAQALDMAFRHLENRHAFGQKLLHHQLIKATFAYANETVARLLEEIKLIESGDTLLCNEHAHQLISDQFTRVSKLMGGHGYLVGGVNTYEYFSLLLRSVYSGCVAPGPHVKKLSLVASSVLQPSNYVRQP